jgi:hypothetical protein
MAWIHLFFWPVVKNTTIKSRNNRPFGGKLLRGLDMWCKTAVPQSNNMRFHKLLLDTNLTKG